jgi:hypothetical protein
MKAINKLLIAIKEFFNKSLKCQRLGHIPETKKVKIRREANSLNCIMKDYKAEIDYCQRCRAQISEPKNEIPYNWYNSVSMSSYRWEELKTKGYLIIN